MRRVTLGGTGLETSCLGFGAASLGSRVGAEEGARALAEAIEAGVAWIDLAPVYGGGRAEAIAGPLLRAHRGAARDRVRVATKAGLALAGGPGGGLRAALMPVARRALAAAGPLGSRLRGVAQGVRRRAAVGSLVAPNTKLPLTGALLTGSLEASLRRLGLDHVDLFALHDPDPAEVGRDDILRTLEDLRAAGKTCAVGVAGDAAAARAALAAGAPYGVVQVALAEVDDGGAGAGAGAGAGGAAEGVAAGTAGGAAEGVAAGTAGGVAAGAGAAAGVAEGAAGGVAAGGAAGLRAAVAARGFGLVTHSVFGIGTPAAAGGPRRGDAGGDAARRMDEAFALNPGGVVLVSMFSERARTSNLAAAARSLPGTQPEPHPGSGVLARRPDTFP